MEFLAIIVLLAFLEFSSIISLVQNDSLIFKWRHYLQAKTDETSEAFLFALLVLPVSTVFLFNLALSEIEFFQWLFQIVVLAWCLGRGDFNQAVDKYLMLWREGNLQGAYDMLRETNGLPEVLDTQHAGVVHANARAALLYNGFERLFVILFWYALLGIEVCVAYRILRLHQQHSSELGLDGKEKLKKWLFTLEWLPARILGLGFAITANFVNVLSVLKENVMSVKQSTIQVINVYALAALGFSMSCLQDPIANDEEQKSVFREIAIFELLELKALLKRSLVLWMALLAVWQLLI